MSDHKGISVEEYIRLLKITIVHLCDTMWAQNLRIDPFDIDMIEALERDVDIIIMPDGGIKIVTDHNEELSTQ